MEGLSALPDVKDAGVTSQLALTTADARNMFYAGNRPAPPRDQWPMTDVICASESYFGASGVPLTDGRFLSTE